jgi:hypothetical protein
MIEPWSIDMCLARLRKCKAEAEQAQSLEPIRKMFAGLTDYVTRHNPNATALANWARMYALWDAHLEPWYREFKEGK